MLGRTSFILKGLLIVCLIASVQLVISDPVRPAKQEITPEEKAEGFVSLFNGKSLDGWQGNKTDYFAENGDLVVDPSRGGKGNLFTGKEYSDFIFRFEFQLTPGANNDWESGLR